MTLLDEDKYQVKMKHHFLPVSKSNLSDLFLLHCIYIGCSILLCCIYVKYSNIYITIPVIFIYPDSTTVMYLYICVVADGSYSAHSARRCTQCSRSSLCLFLWKKGHGPLIYLLLIRPYNIYLGKKRNTWSLWLLRDILVLETL